MNLASSLSQAIDEFTGICAVGAVNDARLDTFTAGHSLAVKITGTAYWDETGLPMAVWAGDLDGNPGTADADTWLQLGDATMSLSKPLDPGFFNMVPTKALRSVVSAVGQMAAMLGPAMDALECAETEYDLDATIEQLKRIVVESKSAIVHGSEALIAHSDLLFNCMVDLLGNMSVTESEAVHLGFDLAAETLDPDTGKKVAVKVGWAKADETSHQYVHSFQLGGASCRAHDEEDMYRMLYTLPAESREHYRHTFIHLHQAAHAVGDYAAGRVGEALAKASTVDEPLLHVDRHELTHRVHAEVAAELDSFVRKMSGEPGRGDHGQQH
jgi:hypothetical protein